MSEPLYTTLGQQLKERRVKRGLSLRKLSKASGVSHTMIDRVEKSKCDIRLGDYAKLCKALKIRIRIIL